MWADFRGIGCRCVRGGGRWGVLVCGGVGRAVVSVVVRFYRGDLRQTYYNLEKRLAVA